MAIAISALNSASLFGFERAQGNDSRQQTQQTRSDINQDKNRARQADARERIIAGEVVARETDSRSVDSAQSTLQQRQAQLSQQQSDNRQISQQAAVQTYQQNQTLITERGEERQVSGILDEYV